MIKQIEQQKEELGIEEKTCAVADAGYFSELEIMKNKDNEDCRPIVSPAAEGKTATVSKSGKGKEVPSAEYESDKFSYDDRRDMYKCPQNQELARITKTPAIDNNGRATHIYRCSPEICAQCQGRELCTKSESGRMLRVSANQKEMLEYLDGLQEKENKNLVGKRKEIVEHPFGTLKRSLGYTYFLLRGLEKTAAEFSLMCFTYNLKRATKILGVRRLIEAIT